MKTTKTIATLFLVLITGTALVTAQTTQPQPTKPPVVHGKGFVDANGDGINDNAPDHDGDGIPNGQDPDYTGSKFRGGKTNRGFIDRNSDGINDNALDADGDGIPNGRDPDYTGPKTRAGRSGRGFVDANGDGINDNLMGGRRGRGGFGNGTGLRPQDGTGLGPGATSGACDGTGPKGKANRGGRGK